LAKADLPWLAGSLAVGGVAAPILLLAGLDRTGASTASLLLSLEAAMTAVIAIGMFGERLGRRGWLGVASIGVAGALLAAYGSSGWGLSLGAVAVAGATCCWAMDNNLTARISVKDPVAIALLKGLVAGGITATIAVASGDAWPSWRVVLACLSVGAMGYGVSLVFFVLALRGIGAARTSALFGAAPFMGAALSAILFPESRLWVLAPAGATIIVGTWLLVTERHEHEAALAHQHTHVHDAQHQHAHDADYGPEPHVHAHAHDHSIQHHDGAPADAAAGRGEAQA
jgi:drug/metabolite transporter (DMT)-like permease